MAHAKRVISKTNPSNDDLSLYFLRSHGRKVTSSGGMKLMPNFFNISSPYKAANIS